MRKNSDDVYWAMFAYGMVAWILISVCILIPYLIVGGAKAML
jgi:hypothetical protein